MDTSQEQRILKLSIGVTVGVSASGFFGGLLAGSQAVLFDGVYSLVDVALTLVALSVLRLVAREGSSRFQYGYWHLEPMVEAMGGAILSLACIYALANAVIGLTTGGHEVKLGIALFWSALLSVVNLVMSLYVSAKARQLQSALLSLDARAWFLSGMMSLAVLGAFLLATLLSGGDRQWLVPYLDSLVLAGICLAVLHTTWKAMREVLQVAPPELDGRVRQVMEAFVAEHGFSGFSSHVAKMGRMQFVEIHILTRPQWSFGSISEVDRLRDEIATRLGARDAGFWLTIDFTSDPGWT
jgi:cation diffusion facilitator family transporter